MKMIKFAVLFALAMLAVRPLTSHALPPPTPEEVLRQRAKDFTMALSKEKYDDALAFVDPDLVAEVGGASETKDKGRHLMNGIFGALEWWGRKISGCRVRSVEFEGANKDWAIVNLHYFTTWKKSNSGQQEFPGDQHWVLKKNVWYFTTKHAPQGDANAVKKPKALPGR
jgi:hypothetical protein